MSDIVTPPHSSSNGWTVVLGPPGTGKSANLLDFLRTELDAGIPSERIAFVSFTRAARQEVVRRVGRDFKLDEDDLPWLRTIHSAAFRLLDLHRGSIMTHQSWKQFAEKFHYKLTSFHDILDESSEGLVEPPRRTIDDRMRYVYEWGHNRRLDVEHSMGRCSVIVPATHFRLFAKRLEDFKKQEDLLDFCDLLERVLKEGLRPDVDVAFIDEAQDLSPLQIAVVEQWFKLCKRVYVAGDDDQSVYSFQGAEPDWLLGLAREHAPIILEQSHRVPSTVHALAQRIIRRNRKRIPKSYRPSDSSGKVERLSIERALRALNPETETLVLARNRMFLKSIANDLFDRRLPYVVEGAGGKSPLSFTPLVRAVKAAYRLWQGKNLDAEDLKILLKRVPSRGFDLLPHGVKTQAERLDGMVSQEDMRDCLGLGRLLETIQRDGPTSVFLKLKPAYRAYFQALLDHYGDIPHPRIHLTSIHGTKGREADLVVVLPDMTRASYLDYLDGARGGNEAENRVAYVAVTRAKKHLVIVQPSTRRYYNYPRAVDPDGNEVPTKGDSEQGGEKRER